MEPDAHLDPPSHLPGMTDLAPPQRYVVRKPRGDPAAARRLADAYDDLAEDLTAQVQHAAAVVHTLATTWLGVGARAAEEPSRILMNDAMTVARALRRSADELRHYAHKLQRAHEHHSWSLGRLVTMGAIVTVGVAAVVVTVGAAAPAEAALAGAAVETAEAAATAADVAGSGAASGLASLQWLLAGLRPLVPFVVPHLVSAGASVSMEAVSELAATHGLDLQSLEIAAAVGFAGSATGRSVEDALAEAPAVTRRLAEAGTWTANGTAGAYADSGEVDPVDSLAFGLTGLVARDVRQAIDRVWERATGSVTSGELVDEL
jgi:uncharacterized protein YukE